jgi:methylated-DNA-[protein]-cysteine S-methyltransferase
MINAQHIILKSPVGRLILFEKDEALTALFPMDHPDYRERIKRGLAESIESNTALLTEAAKQLTEYFDGQRKQFSLPLHPEGTAFQMQVWQALQCITYGKTCTYRELATMSGNENAVRAVGCALHRNPLPIVIPCHRVLPISGEIGGFAWGVDAKRQLLEIEKHSALK